MYGLNPLRRARQARGLTLQDVAAITKLSPRVLLKIERGEFEALPSGILGRAHIRAYARAVGLDAEEVLRGLADRLPAAPDPVEAWRARARARFADDHPVAAAVRDRAGDWQRRAIVLARSASGPPAPQTARGRQVLSGAVDSVILAGSGGVMLAASTWITGTDVHGIWRAARWPLVATAGLMTVLYFTVAKRLGDRTPGAVIAGWVTRAGRQRRHAGADVPWWHVWS